MRNQANAEDRAIIKMDGWGRKRESFSYDDHLFEAYNNPIFTYRWDLRRS